LTATPDGLCPEGEILVDATCRVAGAIAGYRLDIRQPENPFPDDRYRDDDGSLAPPEWAFLQFADPSLLDPEVSRNFGNSLLALIREYDNGWGTFSPLELQLSAAVDVDTLAAGLRVLRRDGDQWREEFPELTPNWRAPIRTLDLQPQMPFESATTYAVVLTSAVKTENGAPLGRSSDFRQVLRGDAGAEVQPVLDYLATVLNVPRGEVALAFTFTTQQTWQDLVAIRERLDDGRLPAPAISFENVAATRYTEGIFAEGPIKQQLLGDSAGDFLMAAVGTTQLYDFRGSDSTFDALAVAGGQAPRTARVRVVVAVPNLPVPEGGFPVMVLGHGLGQSAEFTWEIAQFSSQIGMVPPFVMVAHDFPNHGARGSGNQLTDLARFFHLDNFYAMRDSFRQTAAELLQIRRLVEAATGPPFDLVNKDKILFAGASLGGVTGTTFLAVDSRVQTSMLSVPAGQLVRILEGQQVGSLLAPYIAGLVGLTPSHPAYADFFRMMIHRGLWIMGPGDPINYAPFVTGERQLPGATRKSVLIHEGIGDTILPNETTESLARVMGVPVLTEEKSCAEEGCRVSGMWQFRPADYGRPNEEPHLVSAKLREAQEQLLTYLASDGSLIIDASPRSR
jgi:hypothetical protein